VWWTYSLSMGSFPILWKWVMCSYHYGQLIIKFWAKRAWRCKKILEHWKLIYFTLPYIYIINLKSKEKELASWVGLAYVGIKFFPEHFNSIFMCLSSTFSREDGNVGHIFLIFWSDNHPRKFLWFFPIVVHIPGLMEHNLAGES
jgi:hypothetical protein